MKIVIIGDGKVGYKLARQLSADDYDIVMIDSNERKLRFAIDAPFCYRFIYICKQPRGNISAGLLHQHFLYPVICISSSDTICLVTFI